MQAMSLHRFVPCNLHPGWTGEAPSVSGTVYGGPGRVAFAVGGSVGRRVGDRRPATAGVVRARGVSRIRGLGQQYARPAFDASFCAGCRRRKSSIDGTHAGDWLPVKESPALFKEVDLVVSSDILSG